jgi:sialic acid synthase SpsE
MSSVKFRNGRVVGDYLKPYFIAELNTSHFGNMDLAREMISKAKEAGCDCVKFQSWSPETLYSDHYYRENPIAGRIVKKFSLSEPQLKELSLYASDIGIDFSSTPYSLDEAKFLVGECGVPFVKVASMELNNLPYLRQLALLNVPLVLSTGMGTMEEVKRAVRTITDLGQEEVVILHCTSVYPADPEKIRLHNILGLRAEFPSLPIGYSDHSEGIEIACASVALGACLVEKHFTLDKSRIGMDNQMATEPDEMRNMVAGCHRVQESLGGEERLLSHEEREMAFKMRRSMIAARDLHPGDVLTEADVDYKRPGTGISPTDSDIFIGRKIRVGISGGMLITTEDLE